MGKYRFWAWMLLGIYTAFLFKGQVPLAAITLYQQYSEADCPHSDTPDQQCTLVCLSLDHGKKGYKHEHDHHHGSAPVKAPVKAFRAVQPAFTLRFAEALSLINTGIAAARGNEAYSLPVRLTADIPTPPPRA